MKLTIAELILYARARYEVAWASSSSKHFHIDKSRKHTASRKQGVKACQDRCGFLSGRTTTPACLLKIHRDLVLGEIRLLCPLRVEEHHLDSSDARHIS